MSEDFLRTLSKFGEEYEQARLKYEAENEVWWNSLTDKNREDAFYAVVKRLHKGEIIDRGTYRYILYEVFRFDAGMYGAGMDCGFMDLHNSIYTREEMRQLHDRELAAAGVKIITEKKIKSNSEES
jgi:hypothetical protein